MLASGALAAAIIGFAARQTLANVVAGIMLAITQPLRVGDWVTFEEHYGVVEDVRLNFTVLRTASDQRIVIPNERLAARDPAQRHARLRRDRPRRLGLARSRRRRRPRARGARGGDRERGVGRRDHRRGRPHHGRRRPRAAAAEGPAPGRAARAVPAAAARRRVCWKGIPPRRRIRQGYTRWFALRYGARQSMSRSQRNRRRRRGRGRPRNKAFLALTVVLVLVALAGLVGGRLRRLDRRLRAVAELAQAARPRLALRGARRRRLAPRLHPGRRAAPPGRGRRASRSRSRTRRSRSRTSASTSTRASTTRASSAPRVKNLVQPQDGAGRLDDHDAARSATSTSPSERTYKRKIREAKLAEELENEHSQGVDPRQVPQHRAVRDVGGQTAVGVQAAARIYFDKSVENLTLHESALLAGLPQAPSTYSPLRSPEGPRRAATTCCAKMAELGMISPRPRGRR